MPRTIDQFAFIDADDLLRPAPNPFEIAMVWNDGSSTTFQIPVTLIETSFNGQRPLFLCPRCDQRRRKIFFDGFNRVAASRYCLRLRPRRPPELQPLNGSHPANR